MLVSTDRGTSLFGEEIDMRGVSGSSRGATGRHRLVALVLAFGLSAVACQSTDTGETSAAGVADVAAEPDTTDTGTGTGTESGADGDADGSGGDADEEPTEADFEEAQLAFEQCMADAGIEMNFGGGDGEALSAQIESSGDGPVDEANFEEVMETCNEAFDDIAGSFDPSPEQEAEIRDAEAAFSNCMADAGFEFDLDGGAMMFESDNEDFEAIDAAMEECSTEAFGENGLVSEEGN